MGIAKKVRDVIESLQPGEILTYDDFGKFENKQAVALYLSRLSKKGELRKLQRGMYYIPKKTKFGGLGPSETEIMETLIDETNYISGVSAYNSLGLTTQVSNEVTIVGNMTNRKTKIGKLKIRYVKSKAPVNKQNKKILILLDAIRDLKKIPDTSPEDVLILLKKKMKKFNEQEAKKTIKLSKYYRPYVRSIIGEIFEEMGYVEALKLKNDMNPLTTFKLNISKEILPLKESWNII